jgi:hypothetical protein
MFARVVSVYIVAQVVAFLAHTNLAFFFRPPLAVKTPLQIRHSSLLSELLLNAADAPDG